MNTSHSYAVNVMNMGISSETAEEFLKTNKGKDPEGFTKVGGRGKGGRKNQKKDL